MKGFVFGLLAIFAAFAVYVVVGVTTGYRCLGCGMSAALSISPLFVALLIMAVPVGALLMLILLVLLLRVTASDKQHQDAHNARTMGEEGLGTWLY